MDNDNNGKICCGLLRSKKKEKTETDVNTSDTRRPFGIARGVTAIDMNSDSYNMNHYNRGRAIIFNHFRFDDKTLTNRSGTYKDVESLQNVLKDLSFIVEVHNDLKYGMIYDRINSLVREDHSDSDCLLITVLTHGDSGVLHARDHQYPADTLWSPFAGNMCPTLAGKPKIFFIQACRGEKVDTGIRLLSRSLAQTDAALTYTLPSMADFIIMYATYDGYYSWRNTTTGSWFIQTLCKQLKERFREKDLLTILTSVNREMAINYRSNVPDRPDLNNKKQIGTIVSTLTRLLHFYRED